MIDDFGTGFSSLAYLERFPIDSLKIDRCFVAMMGENGESLEVLRAIFALARTLGLEVIAEGSRPSDNQGHFFSRPVERKAARALLAGPLPYRLPAQVTGNRN